MSAHMVRWTDLGRMEYGRAWNLQRSLVALQKAGEGHDRLLLVEHEPVITMGRRGDPANVRIDADTLAASGVQLYHVERGGDVTYHGPGQLVAYPVLNLRLHRKDVRWYSNLLLEIVVDTLATLGLQAEARHGAETGVWVPATDRASAAKIAALGVRVESWIAFHGVAINIDPCLAHFDWIVPCGLTGVRTTSVVASLDRHLTMSEARSAFRAAFAAALGVKMVEAEAAEFDGLPDVLTEGSR